MLFSAVNITLQKQTALSLYDTDVNIHGVTLQISPVYATVFVASMLFAALSTISKKADPYQVLSRLLLMTPLV